MTLNEIEEMELVNFAEELSLNQVQLREDYERFNSMINMLRSLGVDEETACNWIVRHWQSIIYKDLKYKNIKFKN